MMRVLQSVAGVKHLQGNQKYPGRAGNVAFAADYLNPRKCHLPWETGYAGMVLSNRMPKLFHLVGDDPQQVGRADFIRGAA